MSVSSLDTLPQEILMHLWPYFIKNGDAPAVSLVCKRLASANIEFLKRNRDRIIRAAEINDSHLYEQIRTKSPSLLLDSLYRIYASIRLDLLNYAGAPCPNYRVLLPEDVQLCSESIERIREDHVLQGLWALILDHILFFSPHNPKVRAVERSMDAPAIRNWMIENPELLNAVTRLDLSSSNLGSNKILRGRISSVPKEIGLFVNLQCLLLSGNLLKRLCPEIQQLVNLRHLDLEDNPFSEFPPKFGQLVYHNGRGFYNDKRPISI